MKKYRLKKWVVNSINVISCIIILISFCFLICDKDITTFQELGQFIMIKVIGLITLVIGLCLYSASEKPMIISVRG